MLFSSLSRCAAAALLLAFLSAACNRDPNYAKQQFLTSGNKYFDRGRYKEALIMYRKALAKDPKFGPAYYRMALALEATGQSATLVGALRRAAELLPKGSKEWNDAALRLGEILVQGAIMQGQTGKNKALMDEVAQLQATLEAKSPNSFEDLRLKAEVSRALAAQAASLQDGPALKKNLEDSIASLRRSLAVKPNDTNTAVALGRGLSLYGEVAESEQIYKRLIDGNKTLTLPYVELYRLYVSQRRFPEAEDLLKRAIANNPKEFSLRTLLASYYYSLNKKPEMARTLDETEANFKDFPQAYLSAGDFYARIGDMDSAIRHYKAGEAKDTKNKADYQKREVEVELRQGKKDDAYQHTLALLKESPKDPDARAMEANFQLDRGEVDKALATLQEVVAAKPENYVARYNLGRALTMKGQFPQAMQQFRESLRLRPDFLRSRIALTEVELRTGDSGAALKTAQDTAKLFPTNAAARLLEAKALIQSGKRDAAKEILRDLVAKAPKFAEADIELGTLYLQDKNYAAAREVFQKAYEAAPADARGVFGVAQTYVLSNQPDKAVDLLQNEVNAHPDRADILRGYANLKTRLGRYDSALTDYNALLGKLKANPSETAEVYSAMGQLYVQKGDLKNAIEYLNKAKAIQPASIPLLGFLAETYDRAGDPASAQTNYRAVLAISPNNPMALNNLAYSLASTGANLDEALTLATRAKQSLPNMTEVSDTLGWIYIKKGLTDQAMDTYKDLTTKAPDNPTYRFHYCMALSAKGEKAGAKRECNLALAKHPSQRDEGQIKQLIATLQ